MEDGLLLHNLGNSNTNSNSNSNSNTALNNDSHEHENENEQEHEQRIIYHVTCSDPDKFSFANNYGVVNFDEVLQIPVVVNVFPFSEADDSEIPFAEFWVSYAPFVHSYYDFQPEIFWETFVDAAYIRKKIWCRAVGFSGRDSVEDALLLCEPTEAVVDYDGLSHLATDAVSVCVGSIGTENSNSNSYSNSNSNSSSNNSSNSYSNSNSNNSGNNSGNNNSHSNSNINNQSSYHNSGSDNNGGLGGEQEPVLETDTDAIPVPPDLSVFPKCLFFLGNLLYILIICNYIVLYTCRLVFYFPYAISWLIDVCLLAC
jgi:hypothetical protein